jgi:hypothetical protein
MNILYTLKSINRYLLTFSIWMSSVNFLPVNYLLVLHWSQQGYFSLKVQSCMFILQFYITDISINLYTWLFLTPSFKQVIDREDSKRILWSQKEVWGKSISGVVQRILLPGLSWVSTTPSVEAKLLCSFLQDKSKLGVVALKDSWSWGICAGCRHDTDNPYVTLSTGTMVSQFRGSSEWDTPESWTSVYW